MTPDESLHESSTSVGDSALTPTQVDSNAAPSHSLSAVLKRSTIALVTIGAFVALLLFGVIACPIKLASGLPCPGCGLTRATLAMFQLDFRTMLTFHPLAPVLSPLVFWVIGTSTYRYIRGSSPRHQDPLSAVPKAVWILLLVVFLGLWLVRLLGAFGGHPDGFHPEQGMLLKLMHAIFA